MRVYAIYGIAELGKQNYLVVVIEAKTSAEILGMRCFTALKFEYIPLGEHDPQETMVEDRVYILDNHP